MEVNKESIITSPVPVVTKVLDEILVLLLTSIDLTPRVPESGLYVKCELSVCTFTEIPEVPSVKFMYLVFEEVVSSSINIEEPPVNDKVFAKSYAD